MRVLVAKGVLVVFVARSTKVKVGAHVALVARSAEGVLRTPVALYAQMDMGVLLVVIVVRCVEVKITEGETSHHLLQRGISLLQLWICST